MWVQRAACADVPLEGREKGKRTNLHRELGAMLQHIFLYFFSFTRINWNALDYNGSLVFSCKCRLSAIDPLRASVVFYKGKLLLCSATSSFSPGQTKWGAIWEVVDDDWAASRGWNGWKRLSHLCYTLTSSQLDATQRAFEFSVRRKVRGNRPEQYRSSIAT